MSARWTVVLVFAALGCGATAPWPKPHELPASVSFDGKWDSTWGPMQLAQQGRHVSGRYKLGDREGSVSGDVDGDIFHFVWDQVHPHSHGHGYLRIAPDGSSLEGRWGYADEYEDGGRWAADRDTSGM
jgi:hypothetical protein